MVKRMLFYKIWNNKEKKIAQSKLVRFQEIEIASQAEVPGRGSTSQESQNRDMMIQEDEVFGGMDNWSQWSTDAGCSLLQSKEQSHEIWNTHQKCWGVTQVDYSQVPSKGE